MEDQEIAKLEEQIKAMKAMEEETERKFWQERVLKKHKFLLDLINSLPKSLRLVKGEKGYLIQESKNEKALYLTEQGYRFEEEEVKLNQMNTLSVKRLGRLLEAAQSFLNKLQIKVREHKRKNLEKLAKF